MLSFISVNNKQQDRTYIMIYNKEVDGIEDDTSLDIEVVSGGIVEVMTYTPRVCCTAIVKLDENSLDELIASLIDAKNLISQEYNK